MSDHPLQTLTIIVTNAINHVSCVCCPKLFDPGKFQILMTLIKKAILMAEIIGDHKILGAFYGRSQNFGYLLWGDGVYSPWHMCNKESGWIRPVFSHQFLLNSEHLLLLHNSFQMVGLKYLHIQPYHFDFGSKVQCVMGTKQIQYLPNLKNFLLWIHNMGLIHHTHS